MYFFLPYRVDRVLERVPWATITLIGVNVLVYAVTVFNLNALIHAVGFRMNSLAVYTWFTYMFVHDTSPMHLIGNMYFLWLFGSVLEDAIGPVKYLGLYVIGGFASALMHGLVTMLFLPEMLNVPLVGASGAIAAIIAVFAVRLYRSKIAVAYLVLLFPIIFRAGTKVITSVAGVAVYFSLQLLYGVLQINGIGGAVAYWAHIGGGLAGAAIGLAIGLAKDAGKEYLTQEAVSAQVAGANEIAAARFSELAQKDPDNGEVYVAKARALLATPGNQAVAARDLQRAVEVFARQKRLPEALAVYEDVVQPFDVPLDARTLLTIGGIAESTHRLELAECAYGRILTRHPGDPCVEKARFRLAHVLLGLGEDVAATAAWRDFSEKHPGSALGIYADRRLTETA